MSRSVAIVIESLGGGGAQHVAATLANAWVADGVDVTVVTFQRVDTDVFRLDPRVRRIVIGGIGISRNFIAALFANMRRIHLLRATLRSHAAATVLAFVGSTNILAILASAGLGRRVVISERNDPERQSLGRIWDWMRKLLYRHADLVTANSRTAIEAMAAFVPDGRLRWLPNPLRTASTESNGPVPIKVPFFLAVGRLTQQKGYDALIDAFAELAAALPDWQLVILGDGPLRGELERAAAALAVAERVHFAGYISNPFPWYNAARILVHPARFEGLPNVVLEAMSAGLPVIVSDAQTGLREIVRDGETGIVVPIGIAHELARAMLYLANDPSMRQQFAQTAREAVAPFQPQRAVLAWSQAIFGDHA